jgi:hypothetical protein
VLLSDDDIDFVPRARVNATDDEWAIIRKELYRVGIVAIVPEGDILVRHGRKVVNGAFGVVKPNKKGPTGKKVVRLIVHLKPANACQQMISGSNCTLVGPSAWLRIVLEDDDTVLMFWGDDFACCFYVYRLPRLWWPLFVFEKRVPLAVLVGPEKGGVGMCYVGVTVIPMGWLSASGVVQSIQRGIFLNQIPRGISMPCHSEIRRDREFPQLPQVVQAVVDKVLKQGCLWSNYVDDSNLMNLISRSCSEILSGTAHPAQEELRAQWDSWGIPWSKDKAVMGATMFTRLGAHVDGDAGCLGTLVTGSLNTLGLGLVLVSGVDVDQKSMQIFGGREVHELQFRRCLFSVYESFWTELAHKKPRGPLRAECGREILLSLCACPLRFGDLRARLCPMPSVSDASLTGGAICLAGLVVDWIGSVRSEGHAVHLVRAGSSETSRYKEVHRNLGLFSGEPGGSKCIWSEQVQETRSAKASRSNAAFASLCLRQGTSIYKT